MAISALEVTKLSKNIKWLHESSKFKATVIVFFCIQGAVMAEWDPSRQTVNQHYYIEILTKLHEKIRRKQPGFWINSWIFPQDNAPFCNTLSVKQFLASKNITVLAHPLHSPDLAPCDFFLFPQKKSVLKRTHFVLVEEVKAKLTTLLNSLTENDFYHCSEHWQHHIQLCLD
jgi:hypothetical protein